MLSVTMLSVAGVRSAVHDTGPRECAEAVVFVHGNPGPMDDWESLVPTVAQFARAVAVDMPGFGRADHPRVFDFSPLGYARHLGVLLDQLGVRRAHLVLHDFGGAWGALWAMEHTDALASLTLINTGALPGYRWHRYARIWQTPIVGEVFQRLTTRGMIRAAMNRDNPRPFPPEFVERVIRYADWEQKRAVLQLYRAAKDVHTTFDAALERLRGLDELPVCVVWGARDAYLPVRYAERQREFFPQAEVHVLEGLGHWPFIDDPESVRALVVPFLRRHAGARAARASATAE